MGDSTEMYHTVGSKLVGHALSFMLHLSLLFQSVSSLGYVLTW